MSIRRSLWRCLLTFTSLACIMATGLSLVGVISGSEVRLKGVLTRSFLPAYDILVRPSFDVTSEERSSGLVRDNFLSSDFGGISESQVEAIERVPGLEVAPVENIGYVLATDYVIIPFDPPNTGPTHQLFLFAAAFRLPGSVLQWGSTYVYVTRRDPMRTAASGDVIERLSQDGR